MPWAQADGPLGTLVEEGPQSGAAVVFILLAGIALAVGWPLRQDGISRGRAIGLAVTVAILGLFMITNWSSLLDLQNQAEESASNQLGLSVEVSAGGGLLLYSFGVLVLAAVAVIAFLRGKAKVRAA